jgi:hypothetical protein
MESSSPSSGASFSSYAVAPSGNSLLESTNVLTRFAFLLLVVVIVIIIFRFGTSIMYYFMENPSENYLIKGTAIGSQQKVIYQDPSQSGAVTLYRSVNQSNGIEFTWSVWLNISDIDFTRTTFSTIFYKGNNNVNNLGLNYPANAPGLFLEPMKNNLRLIMNTFSDIEEDVVIPDIPLNKWVNVIIRCQNKTLDVYVNGTISRSLEMADVPKQNYGNVYVATNGGFNGFLSNLIYFNYSLGAGEISNLVKKGPDLEPSDKFDVFSSMDGLSNFLSLRWYMQ